LGAGFAEGVLHVLELEMADDRFNLLHANHSPASAALNENVTLFAVLAQVEPLQLLLLAYPQPNGGIEDFQQDEGSDCGKDPGDERGDDLSREYPSAFQGSQRLSIINIPHGPGGENPG